MKTTLNLPDELLIEAKSMAARRRTTLKALMEHALRRELHGTGQDNAAAEDRYEKNELGFLMLKRCTSETVTADEVEKLSRTLDEEDFRDALQSGKRS